MSARIVPDYGAHITAEDVYRAFTQVWMEERGDLHVLTRVKASARALGKTRPGWTFQMATVERRGILSVDHHLFRNKTFAASHGLGSKSTIDDDCRTLKCRGIFIDHIVDTASAYGSASYNTTNTHLGLLEGDSEGRQATEENNANLSPAQALLHDYDYEFWKGLSLLEIPWFTEHHFIDRAAISDTDLMGAHNVPDDTSLDVDEALPWHMCTGQQGSDLWSHIGVFFNHVLHPIGNLNYKGKQIKDLFTST
jgi:hypothetical protein